MKLRVSFHFSIVVQFLKFENTRKIILKNVLNDVNIKNLRRKINVNQKNKYQKISQKIIQQKLKLNLIIM